MSGLATIPADVEPRTGEVQDAELVRRVRRGDDGAFEALYHRYHRRITAYIFGMVHDHARAEDVAQDVFVSALRRMRETERPIAFKPWVYEIAKNACIDPCRRQARLAGVAVPSSAQPVAARIAALIPLPLFLRRRWLGGSDDATGAVSSHASSFAQWSAQLGSSVDPGWVKAALTAATVAVAGVGASAATHSIATRAPAG